MTPVQPPPGLTVNKMSATPSGSELTYYRFGKKGHTTVKCKMSKNIVCHNRGKTGHIQKACRSKGKGNDRNYRTGKRKIENARQVESEEETNS